MIYRQHYLACVSAASLAMGLCSVPAAAQDAAPATTAGTEQPAASPPADTAPASDSGNDTAIVITAQKRSENVQNVPISIAAFSGHAEQEQCNRSQLGQARFELQATKSVQSSFMRLDIRGIGAASNTTVEPSVAVFLDGAYVPRVGAVISSMLDMESVEVLRGPQGTLFGRNASVGAVSFHTARPKYDEFSAK